MKFVRTPNRIYTIMDFEDGEEIEFAYHSFVPSIKAKGYAFYCSKKDGRTMLLTPDDVAYCQDHPTEKGGEEE